MFLVPTKSFVLIKMLHSIKYDIISGKYDTKNKAKKKRKTKNCPYLNGSESQQVGRSIKLILNKI